MLAISVFHSAPQAQDFSESALKAEFVVRFIDYVRWPNEAVKESFQIGFVGSDPGFFKDIQNAILDRQIRGKTLVLSPANWSNLASYDVVIAAADQSKRIAELFDALRASSTLIVSDDSDDQTHTMINLHQKPDRTMSFQINKANLVVRRLEVSNDILLLGGTEMDVAELYRDMEVSLSTIGVEMAAFRQLADTAQQELTSSRERIKQYDRELADLGAQLARQLQTTNAQDKLIADQLAAVRSGQAELTRVNDSFRQNQALLDDQRAMLEQRLAEVDRQRQNMIDNELLLADQAEKLANQATQLGDQRANIQIQSGTIKSQELLLYSALIGLTIISFLAIVVYRISQDRKAISQQLAQRGLDLEQKVHARTAQLTASEGRYRALSELSPIAVYGTDSQGRCVYVNERWCEFSGLTREQSLGRPWFDALHSDDRARLEQEHQETSEDGVIQSSEFRFMTPQGEITWVYGQRIAERDEQGKTIGFIAAAANITEHKQLEEQLRQAQKMDALGQLTGGVAHDFNNLLAVIEGNLSLIEFELEGSPDMGKETLLEYIIPALHAGRRGAELTKRLLSFARKSPMQPETLDLDAIVRGMMKLISRSLGEDIDLSVQTKAGDWLVEVDPGDLETALLNLVVNARDAMPDGGKLVISTSERQVEKQSSLPLHPGRYVVLTVTDSGSGMLAATIEKAFDPFFTTKEAGHGTGLGLSMVYGFAQQSGGHVAVKSHLDQGSSFMIYLPKSDAELATTKAVEAPAAPAGKESILVVEDDEDVRIMAVQMLEGLGYKVRSAENGEAALHALGNDLAVDLLLTDVILPGSMNGPDVADAARDIVDDIRVLFMSGYTQEALSGRVEMGGSFDLITKPFSYQVLAKKVRTVLGHRH